MLSLARLRQHHACDERECPRCAGVETVVHECRHCGTSTTADREVCPDCGRVDIVRYTI